MKDDTSANLVRKVSVGEIILASQSEARKNLMKKHDFFFRVMPTKLDESQVGGEGYGQIASHRAVAKLERAFEILAEGPSASAFVIAADQTMESRGVMYDKAKTRKEAYERLQTFQGHKQLFMTAIAMGYIVKGSKGMQCRQVMTHAESVEVQLKSLTHQQIEDYLDLGEWRGAVGCIRVEGQGRQLISEIEGDTETLQGLPMSAILRAFSQWQVPSRSQSPFSFTF